MMKNAEIKPEPTVERNGRVMARCQAQAKHGKGQCTQAARKDQRICHVHGGGTKKRKPTGRPPLTDLYSTKGRTDI